MFKKINIFDSYFYEVDKIMFPKALFESAEITAQKKFNHTVDYWKRGCLTRYYDFLFGDLAKNIVKAFLLSRAPYLPIEEYDIIRVDDFKNPDKFDLKVGNNTIEVKSSLEKYTNSIDKIFKERRIIIGLYKSTEELPNYRVQVFFVPKNPKNFWDFMQNNFCRCNNFGKHKIFFENKTHDLYDNINIYIAGWIKQADEKEKIKNRKGTLVLRNNNYNGSTREYINFFISETRNLDDLVEELSITIHTK